jgi:dienelactone hydrolase
MGGRISLAVAGHHPDRVAAAASIHGGNLAAENDRDSPHLLADRVQAAIYVAAADNDPSCLVELDLASSVAPTARLAPVNRDSGGGSGENQVET